VSEIDDDGTEKETNTRTSQILSFKRAIKERFPLPSDLIDKVLEEDDLNKDGYLEYVEYVLGRQRDHAVQKNRNKLKIGT